MYGIAQTGAGLLEQIYVALPSASAPGRGPGRYFTARDHAGSGTSATTLHKLVNLPAAVTSKSQHIDTTTSI